MNSPVNSLVLIPINNQGQWGQSRERPGGLLRAFLLPARAESFIFRAYS
jgi:hypothetical protein